MWTHARIDGDGIRTEYPGIKRATRPYDPDNDPKHVALAIVFSEDSQECWYLIGPDALKNLKKFYKDNDEQAVIQIWETFNG